MNNIKELMDRRGMQQKELAALCNVSNPTVSDWCNGKKSPSGKNLKKLTEIFQVTSGVILGYDPVVVQPQPIVSTDPWNPDRMNYAEQDSETIRLLARGVNNISPEGRLRLLNVARAMFGADFDDEGSKK